MTSLVHGTTTRASARFRTRLSPALAALAALACGVGLTYPAVSSAQTIAERTQAVEQTAQNNQHCNNLRFYWEIGNANGTLASGREGLLAPNASTVMAIASASKWLYGAYVVEKRNGQLTSNDISALSRRSGYINWDQCALGNSTVGQCFQNSDNDVKESQYEGSFVYGGGHDQWHAAQVLNLGSLDNAGLASEMQSYLGNDIDFSFSDPAPAYGIRTDANNYALFLRKILGGTLQIAGQLGSNAVLAVCPSSLDCGVAMSPVEELLGESWHYSLGHWVEDAPNIGDGAFSSPGAYGFYPWIDADQDYYGLIARRSYIDWQASASSTQCGREMREAWETGQPQ